MNKYVKTILGLAAFAILIGGSLYLYNRLGREYRPGPPTASGTPEASSPSGTAPSVSESPAPDSEDSSPAPDFSVQDIDGNPVSLSDFKGKPVVINFWASWCGYCKSEMPEFQEVYDEMSDKVVFMMINVTDGSQETLEKASGYIEDEGFTFPVYYDVSLEAAYAYQAFSLPLTYFIDAEGNITAGSRGAMDGETLRAYLDMIIED